MFLEHQLLDGIDISSYTDDDDLVREQSFIDAAN